MIRRNIRRLRRIYGWDETIDWLIFSMRHLDGVPDWRTSQAYAHAVKGQTEVREECRRLLRDIRDELFLYFIATFALVDILVAFVWYSW